jgi:hypothetical protein
MSPHMAHRKFVSMWCFSYVVAGRKTLSNELPKENPDFELGGNFPNLDIIFHGFSSHNFF